jgi:hypothetical protein
VASALLANASAIEKRNSRGKRVLAKSTKLFDLNATDFVPRLAVVQRALSLLFSAGYHGASAEDVVRIDLCREAMRLVNLLIEYPPAATPSSFALGALMHLHAARLPARVDAARVDRAGGAGPLAIGRHADRAGPRMARCVGDRRRRERISPRSRSRRDATARSANETDREAIVKRYDTL